MRPVKSCSRVQICYSEVATNITYHYPPLVIPTPPAVPTVMSEPGAFSEEVPPSVDSGSRNFGRPVARSRATPRDFASLSSIMTGADTMQPASFDDSLIQPTPNRVTGAHYGAKVVVFNLPKDYRVPMGGSVQSLTTGVQVVVVSQQTLKLVFSEPLTHNMVIRYRVFDRFHRFKYDSAEFILVAKPPIITRTNRINTYAGVTNLVITLPVSLKVPDGLQPDILVPGITATPIVDNKFEITSTEPITESFTLPYIISTPRVLYLIDAIIVVGGRIYATNSVPEGDRSIVVDIPRGLLAAGVTTGLATGLISGITTVVTHVELLGPQSLLLDFGQPLQTDVRVNYLVTTTSGDTYAVEHSIVVDRSDYSHTTLVEGSADRVVALLPKLRFIPRSVQTLPNAVGATVTLLTPESVEIQLPSKISHSFDIEYYAEDAQHRVKVTENVLVSDLHLDHLSTYHDLSSVVVKLPSRKIVKVEPLQDVAIVLGSDSFIVTGLTEEKLDYSATLEDGSMLIVHEQLLKLAPIYYTSRSDSVYHRVLGPPGLQTTLVTGLNLPDGVTLSIEEGRVLVEGVSGYEELHYRIETAPGAVYDVWHTVIE